MQKSVLYIVAADVEALHPCLRRHSVTKDLECALERHSIVTTKTRKTITELDDICLNNVVTQNGEQIYNKNRFITGVNYRFIGDIAVHYTLHPITGVLIEAELCRRFICDINCITA